MLAGGRVEGAFLVAVLYAHHPLSLAAPVEDLFALVARFFRQPDRPVAAPGLRRRSDRRARAVLAHSLGSVAAYEALWAHPDLRVELLVTLGSPLGMPDVVFDRLDPAPKDRQGTSPPTPTSLPASNLHPARPHQKCANISPHVHKLINLCTSDILGA